MKFSTVKHIARQLLWVDGLARLFPNASHLFLAWIVAALTATGASAFASEQISSSTDNGGATTLRRGFSIANPKNGNPTSAKAATVSAATSSTSTTTHDFVATPTIGVNVSGAEYSWETYPTLSDLNYLKSKGILLLRVPFAWEKMQPKLFGPLSSTELANMTTFLAAVHEKGMVAIIDMHNYARYTLNWATFDIVGTGMEATKGSIIGSADVPYAAFKDVWTKLAIALKGRAGLVGYDIMNEPNTLPNASAWPTAAQTAIDGIRSVDMETTIYVEGDSWASASRWPKANSHLHIVDPAHRLVYEAHQYFDDGSGRYNKNYDEYGATSSRGAEQLQPFLTWLKQNHAKGFVGEFGVPQDDARWLALLDNFIATLFANGIAGTYWEYTYRTPHGVPWWPNWHETMALTPAQGWGLPQVDIITKYTAFSSKCEQCDDH